jgi:hypothetical protein
MTILQLETTAANYFGLSVADLTKNGVDMALVNLNLARQEAEQQYDWEFSRVLAQVSVDEVTGGSLVGAVLRSDGVTTVNVGTVVDMGYFDENGNLRAVDWTTAGENLVRQREENRYKESRHHYHTDEEYCLHTADHRLVCRGQQVFRYPLGTAGNVHTVGIECYSYQTDWTSTTSTDIWTTKGAKYLLWQTIVNLNYMYKFYVPRQEGNLASPEKLAAAGLDAFRDWDASFYEQGRTHGR